MSTWITMPLIAGALIATLPASPAAQEQPLSPSGDQGGKTKPEVQSIVAMLESGRLAPAESELRRILARSDGAAARDLLGITLSRLGRAEEAEEQFRRAVALAPDLLPPRQHLARLLLQQDRTDEALTELRAAAGLGSLERRLALWLADAELSHGNASRAAAQLASVTERFQSVQALMQLARLQARGGRNQAAAETLQRALEIAPNSEEALAAHAKVALSVQTPVVAIRALEALTRMHPEVADHAYLLGVARMQVAEMAGAIEALERSLELAPRRPLPLLALGRTLTVLKRFADARDAVRQSLQLDPESAEALAVLAEAEQGLGELELAEEHAAQALARDDDHPRALMTLGLIRMVQARYEDARKAFLQAVASEPGLAKAHYQLSLAFARLGDRETSSKHLQIYRRIRREEDERLVELRTRAGLGTPGMGPS